MPLLVPQAAISPPPESSPLEGKDWQGEARNRRSVYGAWYLDTPSCLVKGVAFVGMVEMRGRVGRRSSQGAKDVRQHDHSKIGRCVGVVVLCVFIVPGLIPVGRHAKAAEVTLVKPLATAGRRRYSGGSDDQYRRNAMTLILSQVDIELR
jgi:hypothetical protein